MATRTVRKTTKVHESLDGGAYAYCSEADCHDGAQYDDASTARGWAVRHVRMTAHTVVVEETVQRVSTYSPSTK